MSNLLDEIKKSAAKSGTKIQSEECSKLEVLFNKMFYLEKNKEKESKFVYQVITRGTEGNERVGLHASAMISEGKDYCLRRQVLSLLFRQTQGSELPVGLKRIFEEGNAVHEKWQRLFLRAGYSKVSQLDKTQYIEKWMLSFTPDIVCNIPGFGEMVGEIKSMNTYQFEKTNKHPSASKQLQFYMYLTGIHKGFVLCEDKNTQNFRLEYYKFDKKVVEPYIARIKDIVNAYNRFKDKKKMVGRPKLCDSPECDTCSECTMKDACWDIGMGRIKLESKKKKKV